MPCLFIDYPKTLRIVNLAESSLVPQQETPQPPCDWYVTGRVTGFVTGKTSIP
jgi:hypothetical protein